MKPQDVKSVIKDLPWMKLDQAEILTKHLQQHRLARCLEIGFMHGVSTCYLAAAVSGMKGRVTSIDLPESATLKPAAEDLLARLNLSEFVTLIRDPLGANWKLMEWLEADERPEFDFAYIDGPHTWSDAGFQFFLVDRLLRPGGWLLFDDMRYYTIEKSPDRDAPWARNLSRRERETPQVAKVWDLLVTRHAGYDSFQEMGNWGLCRKR